MKTILVVYSDVVLNKSQIRVTKAYSFNTSSDIKVGDVIKTNKYSTKLQVIKVLDTEFMYYNSVTGELSNTFTSSGQREIITLELREDEDEVVYGTLVQDSKK